MRILVIEPDNEGGLFHFAYQLCEAIGKAGHDVTLITAKNPEFSGEEAAFRLLPVMKLWSRREVISAEQQASRTIRALHATRRAYRGAKLTLAWAHTLHLARKLRPDVIVVSMILHPHIQAMIRLLAPQDVVLAQICHEFANRDGAKGDAAAPAPLLERFDRVFLLSEATRQDFVDQTGFDATRTTRIPHGGQDALISGGATADEIRAKLGIAPDTAVLLFFGVLRRSKGLEDLIEAFATSEARQDTKLVIAGRATKFIRIGDVEEQIAKLDIEESVILHNAYIENDEIAGFFEMARAVVLPYRTASASGVLHLAYTCGKPVVATEVGGLAEDVIDGRTGYLVPSQDPAALASAIDKIMADQERAIQMGRAGKELSIKTYSWENAARIVTETLQDDLDRRADT